MPMKLKMKSGTCALIDTPSFVFRSLHIIFIELSNFSHVNEPIGSFVVICSSSAAWARTMGGGYDVYCWCDGRIGIWNMGNLYNYQSKHLANLSFWTKHIGEVNPCNSPLLILPLKARSILREGHGDKYRLTSHREKREADCAAGAATHNNPPNNVFRLFHSSNKLPLNIITMVWIVRSHEHGREHWPPPPPPHTHTHTPPTLGRRALRGRDLLSPVK